MAFTTNHSQADTGLKAEGNYEVIITSCEEKTNKNDKTSLNLTLTIRNDVEQKYANGCLFYTAWKAKEPTEYDLAVDGYRYSQIMSISKAANLPDGKSYKDLKEFCADLIGKCVLATLNHREYNGKTYENVQYLNPTKFPDCKHKFKKAASQIKEDEFVSIEDTIVDTKTGEVMDEDDMPF